MPDSQFVSRLSHQLNQKLPGAAAQARFAPQLGYGRHFGPPAHDARQAAVLAVFCDDQDSMFVPLTLRSEHLKDHGGQISLPGGVLEGQETPDQGALRELEEETGISEVASQCLKLAPESLASVESVDAKGVYNAYSL